MCTGQYNRRNSDIKMQTTQTLRTPSDDGLSQHRQNLGIPIAKLQKAQSTTHRAESISLIHEVIADLLAINNLATMARAASFR